ncbi:MAG TPA: IS110 family transposase [Bryobacteraceae bacterium]|nr:IS110 family transposase [Bryobacteraceae bacterium]
MAKPILEAQASVVSEVAGGLFECKSSEERVVYKKLNSTKTLIQRTTMGGSSRDTYYIGFDIHKRTISYCAKDVSGGIQQQGRIPATRTNLDGWMKTLPQPWMAAMEATIFTGWIYDHLLPQAAQVKVAHPLMLRAIAALKKNDTIDAGKIADCLRCDFLPECHMVSAQIRDRRRTLRYRHLLVRQMVQMKNRVSGLLLETGSDSQPTAVAQVKYFRELLATNPEVQESIRPLLKLSRESIERLQKTDYALVSSLERDPLLKERLQNLRTVPGVGPITALTWALEIGDVSRFHSVKQAIATADCVATKRVRPRRFCEHRFLNSETSIFNTFWWKLRSWSPSRVTNSPRSMKEPKKRAM